MTIWNAIGQAGQLPAQALLFRANLLTDNTQLSQEQAIFRHLLLFYLRQVRVGKSLQPGKLSSISKGLEWQADQHPQQQEPPKRETSFQIDRRSEERRVGKECRSRWSQY